MIVFDKKSKYLQKTLNKGIDSDGYLCYNVPYFVRQ